LTLFSFGVNGLGGYLAYMQKRKRAAKQAAS